MIKNYKKILVLPLLISVVFLSGCEKDNYLSTEEIGKLDTHITSLISKETIDIKELQEKISKSIPMIQNKDDASNIINKYIYILYGEAQTYLQYFDIVGKYASEIKHDLGIEKLDVSMYKEISKESKVLGAILEEMHEKDLMVIDENNSFFTEVNVEKILNQYKNYLNNDIIEFLEFRASENNQTVFDANSDTYDIDVLLERAAVSVKKAYEGKSSQQLDNWRSTARHYYEIILVENMTKFLNEDSDTYSNYIQELNTKLEKYKDNPLFEDISKYIEILENNNNDIESDEVVAYKEMIFEKISGNKSQE